MSFKLSERKLRSFAKDCIAGYWNANKNLVKRYGEVEPSDVKLAWKGKLPVSAIYSVNVEGDDHLFVFRYDAKKGVATVGIFKQQTSREFAVE